MYRPQIKTIYCDFDGVIVDTIDAIVSLYNEDFQYYRKFHKILPWEINTYNFKECNCASHKQINTYFNTPRFFKRLEFMPDAERVLKELSEMYNIKIVSMGYRPNLVQKEKWLEKHLDFPYEFIGVNMKEYNNKSHIDMSDGLFLDDSAKNLFSSNASYNVCFGDKYAWNDAWNDAWTKTRCFNWHMVEMLLL